MSYLGIDSRWLQQRQSIHTAREINQQPECWRQTCETVKTLKASLDTFLKPALAQDQLRIILTGAGTSAFAGEALAPWLHQLTGHAIEAISTTDIVSAPEQYLNDDRPILLVSFGRSGNSPESVAAVDIVEQRVHQRHHLILTCNPDGTGF